MRSLNQPLFDTSASSMRSASFAWSRSIPLSCVSRRKERRTNRQDVADVARARLDLLMVLGKSFKPECDDQGVILRTQESTLGRGIRFWRIASGPICSSKSRLIVAHNRHNDDLRQHVAKC